MNYIDKRFSIDKIKISAVNPQQVIFRIDKAVRSGEAGYICVCNSRTTYLANHDPEYCRIQNSSLLTIPDGAPLVWIGRKKGFKQVARVSGKDLMDNLFSLSGTNCYSHYFFGSTPQTIHQLGINLQLKFPDMEIRGATSPPFQPLEDFDIDSLAREINFLKPSFFWCGLGAPKQEKLIALLQPHLKSTICVGVGLAFEYIAGTVKRAPKWMQKSGLEWLFRCIQQPGRVNFKSLFMIFSILPKILFAKNSSEHYE